MEIANLTERKADSTGPPSWGRTGLFFRRLPMAVGYHCVSNTRQPHLAHVLDCKTPTEFESDLRWMAATGPVLNYEEVAAARRSGKRFPRGSFHVSFDDGFSESATVIAPILLRHKIPATFFLTTDFLDNRRLFHRNLISLCIERLRTASSTEEADLRRRIGISAHRRFPSAEGLVRWLRHLFHDRVDSIEAAASVLGIDRAAFLEDRSPYLTRGQVLRLAADGFTLGAHSLSHPRMSLMGRPAAIEHEIVESCRVVADLVGVSQVPFSVPFGASRLNRRHLKEVQRRNPVVGCMFDADGIGDDGLLISRIMADNQRGTGDDGSNLPGLIRRAWLRGGIKRAKVGIRRIATGDRP
ncbi:MAG: polysaccharide deacetylase family protein [Acidobacteria bacterium]|nr:polysaccharide deacetylase family protein [Acidobacteriota bacterium]